MRLRDRRTETVLVPDQVVCRHDHHAGISAMLLTQAESGQRNGRRGVSAKGLEQEGGRLRVRIEAMVQIPGVEIIVPAGHGKHRRPA